MNRYADTGITHLFLTCYHEPKEEVYWHNDGVMDRQKVPQKKCKKIVIPQVGELIISSSGYLQRCISFSYKG